MICYRGIYMLRHDHHLPTCVRTQITALPCVVLREGTYNFFSSAHHRVQTPVVSSSGRTKRLGNGWGAQVAGDE